MLTVHSLVFIFSKTADCHRPAPVTVPDTVPFTVTPDSPVTEVTPSSVCIIVIFVPMVYGTELLFGIFIVFAELFFDNTVCPESD